MADLIAYASDTETRRLEPPTRPRIIPRRLMARYRLWRMVTRREIFLAALDRRTRLDIGRPTPRRYLWLDELMRGPPWHS